MPQQKLLPLSEPADRVRKLLRATRGSVCHDCIAPSTDLGMQELRKTIRELVQHDVVMTHFRACAICHEREAGRAAGVGWDVSPEASPA